MKLSKKRPRDGFVKEKVFFRATYLNQKEIDLVKRYCQELGYKLSFVNRVPKISKEGRAGYIQRRNNKLVFENVYVTFDNRDNINGTTPIIEDLHEILYFYTLRDTINKDTFWKLMSENGAFGDNYKDGKLDVKSYCSIQFLNHKNTNHVNTR